MGCGDLAWVLIGVLLSDFVLIRSAGQREARGGGQGEQPRRSCSGTRAMIYGNQYPFIAFKLIATD